MAEKKSSTPLLEESQCSSFTEECKERIRLACHPPLITLLVQSIGPLLVQITCSLYGIVQTIWVSKGIGKEGMSAISAASAFDYIGRSFGFFVSTAGAIKVGSLYGARKESEAGQVLCDLIRCAILFSVFPIALIPVYKLAFKWFGADDEIVKMAYNYMLPLSEFSFTTLLYLGAMGFLNGEGRSFLSGVITMGSSILNMGVLCPLFVYWHPIGIKGAAYATIISEGTSGIAVIILYFCGVFGVKPKFSQLFKKFSCETLSGLYVGLSQLVSNISIEIPGILVRKLIGMACKNSNEDFTNALAGFNVLFRYMQFTNSVILACTMGYMSPSAYAFASFNLDRWVRLTIHVNWISFLWGDITTILSWVIPKQISLIFSKDSGFLEHSRKMLMYGNGLGFFTFSRFVMPGMLQTMMRGLRATLLSFLSQFFGMIAFAFMMYLIYPNDPDKIVWCISLSYAAGFLLGILFLIKPIKQLKLDFKLFASPKPNPFEY